MKIRPPPRDRTDFEMQLCGDAIESSFAGEPEATTSFARDVETGFSPVPNDASETVSRVTHMKMFVMDPREDDNFLSAMKFWHMTGRVVHGACELPEGYGIRPLPPNTAASELEDPLVSQPNLGTTAYYRVDGISMSYSLSKAVVAIFQIIYASYTLYQTHGNQIARFWYAAFGPTVILYLMMSLIYLAANTVAPDFSALYLVRDDIMEEVEGRTGTKFERVVAASRQAPISKTTSVQFVAAVDETVLTYKKMDSQKVS